MSATKPKYCPDHPDALIRHTWKDTHVRWPNGRIGAAVRRDHRYKCSECGHPLAKPDPDTVEEVKP